MVAIESEIEAKFLDKEIEKLSRTFRYWIGGSDGGKLSLKKGDWFWVGSNQKINYRSVVGNVCSFNFCHIYRFFDRGERKSERDNHVPKKTEETRPITVSCGRSRLTD